LSKSTNEHAEKKTTNWTVPAILGIVLAAVGLLYLRPQVTISQQEPLSGSRPLSIPFQITNATILPIRVIKVTCYIHRMEGASLHVNHVLIANTGWNNGTLDRAQSQTIVCDVLPIDSPPREADMVIVVDYGAWGLPFKTGRQYFRFVGANGEHWQWLQQPSKAIEKEAGQAVDANKN
jgi:hypothetical protein